ncbi:hypothetical protein P8452_41714 [Trifolium repens]|jgi:hypothetical protein|nr:hypothetical protein P8452_41714 [Trifolium repens]
MNGEVKGGRTATVLREEDEGRGGAQNTVNKNTVTTKLTGETSEGGRMGGEEQDEGTVCVVAGFHEQG